MTSNILEYKGYITKVEYSAEDQVLFGKIEGIKDLVNFESETASGIEEEFHAAVDDYLAICAETGKEPNKTYSGTFNVRIPQELHRKLALMATRNGTTLNAEVEKAIEEHTEPKENGQKGTVNYFIYNPEVTKGRVKTNDDMYDSSSMWSRVNAYAGGGFND